MKPAFRFCLAGAVMLVALAGCGRGFFWQAQRAPWRHEAEVTCLKSGEVKLGGAIVRRDPIEGPGVCGIDFPLIVSALGESPLLGFADDLRPPALIPTASPDMPPWPIGEQPYTPPAPVPMQLTESRSVTAPQVALPQLGVPARQPLSLSPPVMPEASLSGAISNSATQPDDVLPDAILPVGRRAEPSKRQAYNFPDDRQPRRYAPPALGPVRAPYSPATIPQATLAPAATLSCPIVAALDHWVSDGVQPAALRWFGVPVSEIHQIGSYACRDMIGSSTDHISEHAFGDALDISGFTLADGRTITVKDGWHGSAEEQGFLHDVQLYACETFSTVLAPGYNIYHYNHMHVDLMRRASGRHPCRPEAISGAVVAARVRAHYAGRRGNPTYTGSIAKQADREPVAVAGADGYVPDHSGKTRAANEDDETAGVIPRQSLTPAADDRASKNRLSEVY